MSHIKSDRSRLILETATLILKGTSLRDAHTIGGPAGTAQIAWDTAKELVEKAELEDVRLRHTYEPLRPSPLRPSYSPDKSLEYP